MLELCADLGGGKTTFTRGLARGLESQDTVSSPTFTLKKIYKGRAGLEIHHFDFYRLNEPGIVADQLAESLKDLKVVTVVEWSDSIRDVLPEERLCIEFHPTSDVAEKRTMHIHYPESKAALIKELETNLTEVEP